MKPFLIQFQVKSGRRRWQVGWVDPKRTFTALVYGESIEWAVAKLKDIHLKRKLSVNNESITNLTIE